MRKLLFTPKKLTAYSFAAAALLSNKKTEAQIAYTDIVPDILSDLDENSDPNLISIDLNNNGVADLTISHSFMSNYSYYLVGADAENNNRIAVFYYFPGLEIKALDSGEVIDSHLKFGSGANARDVFPFTDWDDQEHYMGVRLKSSGTNYYGWIRMQINTAGDQVTVKDYAFNFTPNQAISAGQTTPCGDGYENNNNFSSARKIKSNAIYYALINPNADKDVFKIDVADQNLRVTLFNLPKNYKLALYDADFQLVATSQNPGLTDEQIVYNEIPAGAYYVKVAAGNNIFDADNCYALQIESGPSPYRMSGSETASSESAGEISIYPNPASDVAMITKEGFIAEVRILDLAGRNLKILKGDVEQDQMTVDISDLSSGTYLFQVFGLSEVTVKKLIVQK